MEVVTTASWGWWPMPPCKPVVESLGSSHKLWWTEKWPIPTALSCTSKLDMHTRKAMMIDRADAFLAISGGIGTFEELLEGGP